MSMTCLRLLRDRLKLVPGITVTHVGLLDSVGGKQAGGIFTAGADIQELERLTAWC
jgi:HAE1 family hydrophobic/amphiphilic exporter-1